MFATWAFIRIFDDKDVVFALVGGYLLFRALEGGDAWGPRWRVVAMVLATWAAVRIFDRHSDLYALQWLPALLLAVGLVLKGAQATKLSYSPGCLRSYCC